MVRRRNYQSCEMFSFELQASTKTNIANFKSYPGQSIQSMKKESITLFTFKRRKCNEYQMTIVQFIFRIVQKHIMDAQDSEMLSRTNEVRLIKQDRVHA